jgi:hypothetical protein
LLGLRVRIYPGAWMLMLRVVSINDETQNAGKSRQRNKYGWCTEYKRITKSQRGHWDFVIDLTLSATLRSSGLLSL